MQGQPFKPNLTSGDQQAELPQVSVIRARMAEDIGATLLHPYDLAVRHLCHRARKAGIGRVARIGGIRWADGPRPLRQRPHLHRLFLHCCAEASIHTVCAAVPVKVSAGVSAFLPTRLAPL